MSCKKDIVIDKTPTVTAEVNGIVRKSTAKAYQENSMVIISTWGQNFGIDLYMEDLQVGEYLLGMNQYNEALLEPDLSKVLLGSSNINKQTGGKIIITHFDAKDSTISGTFEFVALSSVSLDSVKNGKFDNIKIVKSEKAFFNKVSYKKDGEAMKFWQNDAYLSYQGRLSVSSSRYVSGEAITFWLPIYNFKSGKQDLFIIGTGGADVVYHIGSSFFSSKVKGTYEWVKLDKINRIAEIRFEAEFEDTNGKKINITEGSMEVQYK